MRNIHFMRHTGLILLALISLFACSQTDVGPGDTYLIPWPDGNGGYSLQYVNIETLRERNEVKGSVADLYVNPKVTNYGFSGEKPNAQTVEVGKNRFVPKDTTSQEMFTIYAHMERLKALEDDLGLTGLINYPRQIGVQTLVKRSKSRGELILDNAMYFSNLDFTIYLPFTYSKKIPLSLNAGVIAHEHFHAIFNAIIGSDDEIIGNKDQKVRSHLEASKEFQFILRAVNEGLADLWAVIYTDNDKFLHASLSSFRTYKFEDTMIPLNPNIPNIKDMHNEELIEGLSYYLGYCVAILIKEKMAIELKPEVSSLSADESKKVYAEHILKKLYQLKGILESIDSTKQEVGNILSFVYAKERSTSNKTSDIKNNAKASKRAIECVKTFPDLAPKNKEDKDLSVKQASEVQVTSK